MKSFFSKSSPAIHSLNESISAEALNRANALLQAINKLAGYTENVCKEISSPR